MQATATPPGGPRFCHWWRTAGALIACTAHARARPCSSPWPHVGESCPAALLLSPAATSKGSHSVRADSSKARTLFTQVPSPSFSRFAPLAPWALSARLGRLSGVSSLAPVRICSCGGPAQSFGRPAAKDNLAQDSRRSARAQSAAANEPEQRNNQTKELKLAAAVLTRCAPPPPPSPQQASQTRPSRPVTAARLRRAVPSGTDGRLQASWLSGERP